MIPLMSEPIRRGNRLVKKSNVWDVGLVKLACMAFALMLAKLVPAILSGPVWLYVSATAIVVVVILARSLPMYLRE